MQIGLVNMPFAGLRGPSIAIGLLKSLLQQAGLSVTTFYANFWLAEAIGLPRYEAIHQSILPEDLLGDWLFGDSAFPDYAPNHDTYLEQLVARNSWLQQFNKETLKRSLYELRAMATEHIEFVAMRVLEHDPRIVGCSSVFQQHVASLALLRQIKERRPDVVTILGGANCETSMGLTTHSSFRWVDFVVSGEADELIVDLCRDILDHGAQLSSRDIPDGVFAPVHRKTGYPCSDNNDGEGIPRATSTSLESLPAPAYDDYFDTLSKSSLREHIQPGLSIEASRGCWWGEKQHCTFCGLNGIGMQFRKKTPGKVLQEMTTLAEHYDVKKYSFVDNILDMTYFKTLLPELEAGQQDFKVFFEIKANLTKNQVQQLRDSGITFIQPGIESMHSKVLSLMKKGVAAWQNVQLLKWCRKFGIRVAWNMLFDFPGERDEWYVEMAEWLPLISHLEPPGGGGIAGIRIDRFSPYHSRPHQYDLALKPAQMYEYVYPLVDSELEGQAYYFEDTGSYGRNRINYPAPAPHQRGAKRVRDIVSQWFAHFWSLNPSRLTMQSQIDCVEITDYRHCAVENQIRLTGLAREIYLSCDQAIPCHKVYSKHETKGRSSNDIKESIQMLLDKRIMLRLDDRLISLAIDGPLVTLPPSSEAPGGYVNCPAKTLVPDAAVGNLSF